MEIRRNAILHFGFEEFPVRRVWGIIENPSNSSSPKLFKLETLQTLETFFHFSFLTFTFLNFTPLPWFCRPT